MCVQTVADIHIYQTHPACDHKLNEKSFEWILKKCQNITKIGPLFRSNANPMSELMIKRCNHFNYISMYFDALSVDTIPKFFAKFATNLKSIESYCPRKDTTIWKCVDNCLKDCINLTN